LQNNKIDKNKIQTWLITGGSTGFGRALALRLNELGYIVATTSRDIKKLDDLPVGIHKIQLDVRDKESCEQAVKIAIEKMGRIDVLVNNAGISQVGTFEELPAADAKRIIDTNFWGTYYMTRAVIPSMRQNKNGTIVNISSITGIQTRLFGAHYAASKFAVEGLTRAMKFECKNFARFMAVEFGGFGQTGILKRQKRMPTQIDEYKNIGPYRKIKNNFINNIGKAIEQVINTVNQETLPQCLPLGKDAYLQFQDELKLQKQELSQNKNITKSCDDKPNKPRLEKITNPRNNKLQIQNWMITGGSTGLGRILALRLSELGYTVATTSRDIKKLDDLPVGIHKIQLDVRDKKSCENAVETAIEKMGRIDVLVNNAGIGYLCKVEECPDDIAKNLFDTNYVGTQNMILAALPGMRQNKNGTIVNIGSIAGIQPRENVAIYAASKFAAEGLTRALKYECKNFARFMAVECVYMQTGFKNPALIVPTKIPEYTHLGRYNKKVPDIKTDKNIIAQQIINAVNKNKLPQSLPMGTESYLLFRDEIRRMSKEFRRHKKKTLAAFDNRHHSLWWHIRHWKF
jgi:NADP-dependent 3-hydroxy acid dehydrogenase YdfG